MAKPALIGRGQLTAKELQAMIREGRVGYAVDVEQSDPRRVAAAYYKCPTCGEPVAVVAYSLVLPRTVYVIHGGTVCIFEVESEADTVVREAKDWPRCAHCGGGRVITVVMGDPRDQFFCKCPRVTVGGKPLEYEDYMLHSIGIGEEFSYCLDCGRIQGEFPVSDERIQESFGG